MVKTLDELNKETFLGEVAKIMERGYSKIVWISREDDFVPVFVKPEG